MLFNWANREGSAAPFDEIRGGHIGCDGGGGRRQLLPSERGTAGSPCFLLTAGPFPEAQSRLFPDYVCQTIETGVFLDHAFVIAQTSAPPGPDVPPPDFHIPKGRGCLGVLEPPARFLRWTDHVEMVLPAGDVARRCQAAGARSAPGKRIHGCSYTVAGRCLIIRVDDPGVVRHELAHCNGWKHPEP